MADQMQIRRFCVREPLADDRHRGRRGCPPVVSTGRKWVAVMAAYRTICVMSLPSDEDLLARQSAPQDEEELLHYSQRGLSASSHFMAGW
jgi:hypothetical protein